MRRSVSICGRLAESATSHTNSENRGDANPEASRVDDHEAAGSTEVSLTLKVKQRSLFVSRTRPSILRRKNDQLMSACDVLAFKAALRLEWRGRTGQDEAEQSFVGLLSSSGIRSYIAVDSTYTAREMRYVSTVRVDIYSG
jgi:hypothetical protein